MTTKSYTDGVIEITLDGKEYELVSSAKAMRAINTQLGGFQQAYAAIQSGNVEAIEAVYKAGLTRKEAEDLDVKIYKSGAMSQILPAMKFVLMVNNGGKHPDNETEVAEEDEARPTSRKTKPPTEN